MKKPNICVDFDGVIHDYKEGWQDGLIYGNVTPGFFEWCIKMHPIFNVLIFSSRCKTVEGTEEVRRWINTQFSKYKLNNWEDPLSYCEPYEVVDKKPPALVYIDDRALRFNGDWNAPELSVKAISEFTPWNIKKEIPEDTATDYIRGIAAL